MLGTHMPEVIPEFDIKVTLLLELLQKEVRKGGKAFKPLDTTVTYQDPCRLGRISGCYDAPRYLLEQIPGLTLREMENSGRGAICCGNNGFINCDAYSKSIQVQRLQEVRDTGAEDLAGVFARCRGQRFLVFSIDSDVCSYPEEQAHLVSLLKRNNVPVRQITVHSDKGHDAFLLEPELFAPYLSYTLRGR